ncbi:MiaB/RimO family radical SAM methylthiotransferase [Rhabdothermincola salaria]|uniref:MiaB/RimO family radical SAM methylthiotransferase n=1 Tax=Rhabdothermincola salaria TaxID=2903142 RepID=UPI001E55A442|nr:MiaB/RimO family radical SAM methylthiotransferase [Rhabdothermincola salaria]
MTDGRTYAIRTFGCQMNEHDSERLAGLLEADGLVPAASPDDADVVVLNTCCIRENADNKLYGTLGHLKSAKAARPGMEIVVSGCLAQKDRDLIAQRAGHVDVVLGTHNVHRAVDLLHQARESGPVVEIWDEALDEAEAWPSALPVRREVDHAAWVTIQIGCDNNCAFCIVPSVRGREISRPFGELVTEVERLAADGVLEVTLLGQNVNSYGRDLTTSLRREDPSGTDADLAGALWAGDPARRPRPLFADLLGAVAAVDGIRRVRYTSPHPKDLRPETIAAMAGHPEVCPHLHLPLQSGSDDVLAAMHRGYTGARYLEKVAAARAAIDDLALTTDIIVGFPGETAADFEATLEVAATAEYDSAYTFIYSPRPGTEAAELTERFVDPAVVGERFDRLRVVVERSALAKHQARIGRTEEVVVEGPSKRDPSVLTGRTTQNKLVHFASERPLRAGTLAETLVVGAGPHFLRGELVEVLAAPRHRTRIPVVSV